jgi:hypothetical protein
MLERIMTIETECAPSSDKMSEATRLEYSQTCEFLRHTMSLRRDVVIFVTAVQGTVITVVGDRLANLSLRDFVLSVVAFAVGIIGIFYDQRLRMRMRWYDKRAQQIENVNEMALFSRSDVSKGTRFLGIRGTHLVIMIYGIICIFWMALWIRSLFA